MAGAEDPAAVLEAFIHDVANLPAEIQHLYEEAQVKQDDITDCQRTIDIRDGNIQKFIKHNTSLVRNPKEDQYSKTILENYDRMRVLQDEKILLIEKASSLLDRYVKRLDKKIADLQSEGAMPIDPQMPSLLKASPGNLVAASSASATGTSTPLQPISINAANGTSVLANEAIRRLQQANNSSRPGGSPAVLNIQNSTIVNSSAISGTSASAAINALNRGNRELSAGTEKRRRLAGSLGTLPPQPSNLARQSSLGPGTPKPSTPGGSRAGSVGPRPAKKAGGAIAKKGPLTQINKKKLAKSGLSKKSARRLLGTNNRASPSTTAGDSSGGEEGSEEESASRLDGEPGGDDEMDDIAEDDTKYCYCGQVSYGNMVACDNADCKGQWFHWKCAGITEEPQGEWLCKNCARLPASKIRREKDDD